MINNTQRRNLAALAIGLENLPKEKREHHFDMKTFIFIRDEIYESPGRLYFGDSNIIDVLNHIKKNPCGTTACIGGWGIVMGIGITDLKDEMIEDYIKRVYTGEDLEGTLFRWIFDGRWVPIDNTALGGAARIRYFLDNGIPDQSVFQDSVYQNVENYRAAIAPYKQKSIEKQIKALARRPSGN